MNNLPQHVIDELRTRHATPKPRWHFVTIRAFFWLLVILSLIIGGIACAVAGYVFLDNDGLHVTLSNLFQVIPYIWLVVLILFMVCAYFGFRHTRNGYRYTNRLIIVSLLVTSMLLGFILNQFDFGQSMHKYLLQHTEFYNALIYSNKDRSD